MEISDTQIGFGFVIHTCSHVTIMRMSSDNSQSNAIAKMNVAIVVWNKQVGSFVVFEPILNG